MAKPRTDSPVTLSVLDRLIDEKPNLSSEPAMLRAKSLRELRAAVRRDLEWLLNSRQPVQTPPKQCEHVEKSLYNYGLPDINSANVASPEGRNRLMRAMEAALALFEPRLANVRVVMTSAAGEKTPQLRFRVEGLLRIDPTPEQVSFDTLFEMSNGEYKVQS
jgi:type VI secretion system protein ImpF